jgi:hypothetical protein
MSATVLDKAACEQMNMGCYLAVAAVCTALCLNTALLPHASTTHRLVHVLVVPEKAAAPHYS